MKNRATFIYICAGEADFSSCQRLLIGEGYRL